MTLVEHLRELRSRLVISLAAAVPGVVLGLVFYRPIAQFLVEPFCQADIQGVGTGDCSALVQPGLMSPFNTALTVGVFCGILFAAPVWLFQIWAFVTPGLHTHERRWSIAFLATAVPLFFSGAVIAYLVLPKAIDVLLSFTLDEATNLVYFGEYLGILVRMILVFGLAFELPVFIAMLNVAGVLTARGMLRSWRYAVFGIFVFAAVATPTADPFSMLALAVPMVVLFLVAYVFCAWNDRRRASRRGEFDDLDDDEVSPLDER